MQSDRLVGGGFGLWCRPRVRGSRADLPSLGTRRHVWRPRRRSRMIIDPRNRGSAVRPNERSVRRKLILKRINYWRCRYHVSSTSLTALCVVSVPTEGSNSSREPVYTEVLFVARWQRSAVSKSRGRFSFFSRLLNHVSTLSAASTAFFGEKIKNIYARPLMPRISFAVFRFSFLCVL